MKSLQIEGKVSDDHAHVEAIFATQPKTASLPETFIQDTVYDNNCAIFVTCITDMSTG